MYFWDSVPIPSISYLVQLCHHIIDLMGGARKLTPTPEPTACHNIRSNTI